MKKALSILLALVLTLGITLTASALSPEPRITGMADNLTLGYSDNTWLGDVHPQDKHVVHIPLSDAMFTWEDGRSTSASIPLTPAQIRNARLGVRHTSNRGVVEEVSINSRESRIEVKFVPELASVNEVEFDFTVYLTVNGRSYRDQGINLSGVFKNPEIQVREGDRSVGIADGTVAQAQEHISSLDVQIGNGVTVKTRMLKDMRVYGTTTLTPDHADEQMFKANPAISDVINLRTVGLDRAANSVMLDSEYRNYHVYDANLAYLGTGRDTLPFKGKYYLAAEKLALADVVTDEEPEKTDAAEALPSPEDVQNTGSGSGGNANENPNTGR